MKGTITKHHFLIVSKEFGWKIALKLLFSRKPVALILLMTAIFTCSAWGSDSWNPMVQQEVFEKVAKLMNIENPGQHPPVVLSESMTDDEFASAIGTDIFGNLRGNFYSWRLDIVLLSETRDFVHVLAHEYCHYFQFHYLFEGDHTLFRDMHELQACKIQDNFR